MELPAKIGQYQIKRLLGAGAMGHVYLAHDPHLDRDVAIKVLPRDFAADEELGAAVSSARPGWPPRSSIPTRWSFIKLWWRAG